MKKIIYNVFIIIICMMLFVAFVILGSSLLLRKEIVKAQNDMMSYRTSSANDYKASSNNKVYCSADINDEFADNSVIVVLNHTDETDESIVDSLNDLDISHIKYLKKINNDIKKDARSILQVFIKNPSKQNVLNTINELEKFDFVYIAEPDYIYTLASTPNDPYYTNGNSWNLNGTHGINADEAWDYATGNNLIRVG